MTKIDIKTSSENDLQRKIDNIKAEQEKAAEALKRYEEELKVRKRDVPLGVPQEGLFFVDANSNVDKRYGLFSLAYVDYNCFLSKESAAKHAEMLLSWRKALVDAANCEPIDIEVLKPLLRKGWVAMDGEGDWCWYEKKPYISRFGWTLEKYDSLFMLLSGVNIKPAENWKDSLQECGL